MCDLGCEGVQVNEARMTVWSGLSGAVFNKISNDANAASIMVKWLGGLWQNSSSCILRGSEIMA